MAMLSCRLNPPKTAEGLEVRWYHSDQFDTPVLLYRAGKIEDGAQPAAYKGRASFGQWNEKSGGLRAGDLTLELVNVTLEDAGEYTCYVTSDKDYQSGSVSLIVTEEGTTPLLSAMWIGNDLVNVSCESDGWYPKPKLRLSDRSKVLTPKSVVYSNDSAGLVSVHSWLVVSSSSEMSCLVGLNDNEEKKAMLHLGSNILPQEQGSSKTGWVLFSVTLVALIVVLGGMYFKYRGKGSDEVDGEKQKLLPCTTRPWSLQEAKKYHVDVALEGDNTFLKIKNGLLRDNIDCHFPDGEKVTCLTSIKGSPGISSGEHYWEVSLCKAKTGLKKSWWVGVTSASDFQRQEVSPTPSNGFWFLSSNGAHVCTLNTEPVVSLPAAQPQTLGVFVDYGSGELSFYNVEDHSLIASVAAEFTGEIFPFFNPGKGDKTPMEILTRKDQ
ncbi:butyrophilin subfamily 1 member A1-like isoform X2 [Genypterus blacodes]